MSSPTDLPLDVRDLVEGPDVPDSDAAGQAREVTSGRRAAPPSWTSSLEVDEYDAAEQSILVNVDEDEYR